MTHLLPAPSIVGPVSSWSRHLLVGDVVAGAKLMIACRRPDQTVAQITAIAATADGEQLVAIPPQPAGSRLWAMQAIDDAHGDGDEALGPIVTAYPGGPSALPQIVSRPYVGGRALWIEGVFPGATIRIVQGGSALGEAEAVTLAGIAQRPTGARLGLSHPIQADLDLAVLVLDPNGGELARAVTGVRRPPQDFPPGATPRQLPPVKIAEPFTACSAGPLISDVVDGAEVTLVVDGEDYARATFDRGALTFLLSGDRALGEGRALQARQAISGLLASAPTDTVVVGPVPTPGFIGAGPICAGGRLLVVSNVDPNASVTIAMTVEGASQALEQVELAYPPAGTLDANATRIVELPRPAFAGSDIVLWQSRCGKAGAKTKLAVGDMPSAPPIPRVVPPLVGCDDYVYTSTGIPMRIYSARAADASGIGWPGGAITGWVIGDTNRVTPALIGGDKIRVMTIACDDSRIWSPESDPWIVGPSPSPSASYALASGLILSLSADPDNPAPLLENRHGPIYVLKGPRAHRLTATGGGQILGSGVAQSDGITVIDLVRPLILGEEVLVQWTSCSSSIVSKGNPSGLVRKLEPPLAPTIEAPSAGLTDVPLGLQALRVRDPGLTGVHPAETIHVTIVRQSGGQILDKTFNAPLGIDMFDVNDYGTVYTVTAQSRNAAGTSPMTTIAFTSVAPPQPAPDPIVHATIALIPDRSSPQAGIYSIAVHGSGFAGDSTGAVIAKYADVEKVGNDLKLIPATLTLSTLAIKDGKFAASSEFSLIFQVSAPGTTTGYIQANSGFTLSVSIGARTFEASVVNTFDGALQKVGG